MALSPITTSKLMILRIILFLDWGTLFPLSYNFLSIFVPSQNKTIGILEYNSNF